MKTILILVNHVVMIYHTRRELVKGLLDAGYAVHIAMPASEKVDYFRQLGCVVTVINVRRRGMNPFSELRLFGRYRRLIRHVCPAAVLTFTVKPNLYGTLTARLCGIPCIANVSGLGSAFFRGGMVNRIVRFLYKISVKRADMVFFQNAEDREICQHLGLAGRAVGLLPGSGVNLTEFTPLQLPPEEEIRFVFIGRIMKEKGIDDYLACAEEIGQRHRNVRFDVAGFVEESRYAEILREKTESGIIRYVGFVEDIRTLLAECHCCILPSYHEGMPNVLLEGGAAGRGLIASDIAACREIIVEGKNGYLFPVRDREQLIKKTETFLALSFDEKKRMGRAARKIVEEKFDRTRVVDAYLNALKTLIPPPSHPDRPSEKS